MDTNKPLLMEKPQRGREMRSQHIAGQEQGKSILMHEGYVGGKKYMVPDEDLAIMKTLVEHKLGKKPKDRFVRDYEFTHLSKEGDDRFRKLSQKLKDLGSLEDEDLSETTKESTDKEDETTSAESEKKSDEKTEDEEEPSEEDEEEEEEEETEEDDKKDKVEDEDETSKESAVESESTTHESDKSSAEEAPDNASEKSASVKTASEQSAPEEIRGTQPFHVIPTGVNYLRFLLSGHLRNNTRPIFIFHEYEGISPIGKKPDFASKKNEGDVDLFISGKFYQENILEEVNNKLKSLNIEPEKIIIDKRSKVYEEKFYELLRVGEFKIDVEGKFIKQMDTKKYTPFLAFNVHNVSGSKGKTKSNESTKKPPTTAYVARHDVPSLFYKERVKNTREEGKSDKSEDNYRRMQRQVSLTPSLPKPDDEEHEYEPHLKKNPSRRPSRQPRKREHVKDAAGDVGSDGTLVYNCDVTGRRPSGNKNIFRRFSQLFSSKY